MPRRRPEGCILARHRGGYCVVWYADGRRQRRSLGTDDAALARTRLGEFVVARERNSRPNRPTVGQIMDLYIADRKERVRSPGAIGNAWKAMGPFFRDLLPEHVTQASCEAYQRARPFRSPVRRTRAPYLSRFCPDGIWYGCAITRGRPMANQVSQGARG